MIIIIGLHFVYTTIHKKGLDIIGINFYSNQIFILVLIYFLYVILNNIIWRMMHLENKLLFYWDLYYIMFVFLFYQENIKMFICGTWLFYRKKDLTKLMSYLLTKMKRITWWYLVKLVAEKSEAGTRAAHTCRSGDCS